MFLTLLDLGAWSVLLCLGGSVLLVVGYMLFSSLSRTMDRVLGTLSDLQIVGLVLLVGLLGVCLLDAFRLL